MTAIALTTELEAINTLLAAINEAPAATLEDQGIPYLATARATLNEISRAVQAIGWHFNSEDDYPIPLTAEGKASIPINCLKVVASDPNVIQRGTYLYDKGTHSWTFTTAPTASIVQCLEWAELPQCARHFIMIRAARIFQTRQLGSESQYRFSADDENMAERILQEAEAETGQYNYFSGSQSVSAALDR